jgi:tetratricopeptide (TPR) repeat protein
LLFAVGPALAASKPNKQAQENAARRACLDGDYTEGVAILSKLFVETKDATFIFNQGRCFEQNRRYQEAIARFQEYLRTGRNKLDASDKAEAEQHIADCKEILAQERGTSPPPTTSQPLVASPPPAASKPEPEPTPEPSTIVIKPARQAASTSDGAGLRIGGIVVASVGVAAAGAGLLFNLKANSMVNDMYKTQDGYTKESDRKTYANLAWIGYGVGAACVVTGAILYGVGLKAKSSSSSSVALVPTLGPDHAGALLTGAF